MSYDTQLIFYTQDRCLLSVGEYEVKPTIDRFNPLRSRLVIQILYIHLKALT